MCIGIKSGIEHLHSRGFSRNDVNPYNIMFKLDGTAVIIDFDSHPRIGEKLVKGGAQFYEFTNPEKDYSGLKHIEESIDNHNNKSEELFE